MASEPFRPRLPLDPFAAIDHTPWSIPKNISPSHPQIILILGEPPVQDLIPLLTSTSLSRSLLLIATHTSPLIPATTRGPAVRILRLSQPLAAHDAGALRLVNIFERAQRVALLWPRDSPTHAIQLAQPSPIGDFSIVEPISYIHDTQDPTINELVQYPSPAPSLSESGSSSKRRSFLSPYKKLHRATPPQKYLNDKVNFDAIINFLPRNLPDKALLKHTILVTTLSAQFFAPPTYILSRPSSSHNQSTRQSLSSSSSHASPTVSSPSGSRSDTSHGSSPPQRRLSQSWRSSSSSTSSTSRAKNRFSHLFRAVPPSSTQQPGSGPLTDLSGTNQTTPEWEVKNVHLVHVLPRGWKPDSDPEFGGSDRRAPSPFASSSRLAGPSYQSHLAGYYKPPGGVSKPKLVQNIEQFLLSFAYPLGSLVSDNSGYGLGTGTGHSDAGLSNSNQRPKSIQPSYINGGLVTTPRPRPTSTSTLGFIGNARPYKPEGSRARSSTLPSTSSYSNPSLKPTPYLLAPGLFNRCVGRPNARYSRCSIPSSGPAIEEEELNRDQREDIRGGANTALTIGEVILLGALDFDHTRPESGPRSGRAWIGSVSDVVIEGARPGSGSGSSKGKNKAGTANTEKMKTTSGTTNFGLPSPPDSSSSANSTESGEEQMISFGHSRHIPPALSSPTQPDEFGSFDRVSEKREALVVSPVLMTPTATEPKASTNNITFSSPPTSTPTSNSSPSPLVFTSAPEPAYTNKVKDSNGTSDSVPRLPLLVVHRDKAPTPYGSGDRYDLGLGHGVQVPPMAASMKPGSRSASGSSGMIPLETQGRGAYRGRGFLGRKGSERKGFMGTLRKMGEGMGMLGLKLKA